MGRYYTIIFLFIFQTLTFSLKAQYCGYYDSLDVNQYIKYLSKADSFYFYLDISLKDSIRIKHEKEYGNKILAVQELTRMTLPF